MSYWCLFLGILYMLLALLNGGHYLINVDLLSILAMVINIINASVFLSWGFIPLEKKCKPTL